MTNGEKHKIKTYLVPTTYEMVEAMEKGEAPSFLHVGACLDDLTNGEVIKKMFPHYDIEIDEHKGHVHVFYEDFYTIYPLDWWNRKWGE